MDEDFAAPTPECPDESTCVHCGHPIFWNDYGYVHASGFADCVMVWDGPRRRWWGSKQRPLDTQARPVEMRDGS